MAGSASFNPPPIPLGGQAWTVLVASYDRSKSSGSRYTLTPNIRCERVEFREGGVPPSAQFSYIIDTSDPSSPYPSYVEQLWPLKAQGNYVATVGEELVVFAFDSGGNGNILFDGFVDNPQADIAPGTQRLSFTCSGVAVRCWDQPRTGAYYCPATNPHAGTATLTDLEERFNPDGEPNATPDGFDVNQGAPTDYPVFLDWRIERFPDPRREWTLGMFARYLMYTRPAADLAFVDNPKINLLAGLDGYLVAVEPTSGDSGTIDLKNPATYTVSPITLDDVVATDRAWPEVLSTTLDRHGFAMRFVIGSKDVGAALPEPTNTFEIYRRDALYAPRPKTVRLQKGGALDPAQSNAARLTLVRNSKDAVNSYFHVARPNRYEISVVLAPGFPILTTDANTPDQWNAENLLSASADNRKKYRVFVADEAGDGHWDFTAAAWTTSAPLDLTSVLGKPANGVAQWVPRLRPGFDPLFSIDDQSDPRRVNLSISTSYAGTAPAIWDGTSPQQWQSVGRNGWELLDDALGIRLTGDKPNAWRISDPPAGSSTLIPGNVARVVEAMASPTTTMPRFWFLLTVVIEGDHGLDSTAGRRACVPVPWVIQRRIDCRDIFAKNLIDPRSLYSALGSTGWATGTDPRDDTAKAAALSRAQRWKYEFPAVAGQVTIPGISTAYFVGDRLSHVDGRGISLRANAGAAANESPTFPFIVSSTYDLSGDEQKTIFEISDARQG